MFFIATYGHWINDEEPAIGIITPGDLRDLQFVVEAGSRDEAKKIAKKYEGIETHAYEGLGSLKALREVAEPPEHLCSITIYEEYLPESVEKRRRALIERLIREGVLPEKQ